MSNNLISGFLDLENGNFPIEWKREYDDLTYLDRSESPATSRAAKMENSSFLLNPSGDPFQMTGQTMTNLAVVLDLDETLVHTFSDMKSYKELGIDKQLDLRSRSYQLGMTDVVTPHGKGERIEMWGVKRPHINEFLIFCFSYFKVVIVWSAGKYKYVHSIVDNIFSDIISPHLVLTWDDCVKVDGICDKDLSKIYQHPELKNYVRPDNTLIIDDREYSFNRSSPDNGVLIPQYSPHSRLESLRSDDIALLQLQSWLQTPKVINTKDVRSLDKSQIFRTSLHKTDELIPRSYFSQQNLSTGLAPKVSSTGISFKPLSLQPVGA